MATIDEALALRLKEHGVTWPPTADELPYDDGEPMESHNHALQAELLKEPLDVFWADRDDVFVGGNMFVYFNIEQSRQNDFRGPDVLVALDVPRGARKSWVVWEEGKGPDVVIELLSDSTAAIDRGIKKRIYEDRLRVPEYFWFHPFTGELAGFRLEDAAYEPIAPDAQGRLLSRRLQLMLVLWEGSYRGVQARWLRWATLDGELLPTGEELAARAQAQAGEAEQRADQERQRADQAEQRAEEERQRAEEERQRAAELEALIARYRARFGDVAE